MAKPYEPLEFVDGKWQRAHGGTPLAIVMYAEEAGPELPAGWLYWCLGRVGSAISEDHAKIRCELILSERGAP